MPARAIVWLVAALTVSSAAAADAHPRTRVSYWSPLNGAAQVKGGLEVTNRVRGSCQFPGSEALGAIGFRCGSGNYIFDPCWRDGAGPTDHVVCAANPWARRVTRFQVRDLASLGVESGVPQHRVPWGIQLAHHDRCTLLQGAHDSMVTPHGRLTVDYACTSGRVLLRNLRRRDGAWSIGAARYHHHFRDVELLGRLRIRRAIFGTLPPPQERQRQLAHGARAAARRVIHRTHPSARLRYVDWVRLALPDGECARVRFFGHGYTAVLRRAGGRWVDADACPQA